MRGVVAKPSRCAMISDSLVDAYPVSVDEAAVCYQFTLQIILLLVE